MYFKYILTSRQSTKDIKEKKYWQDQIQATDSIKDNYKIDQTPTIVQIKHTILNTSKSH